ncbi:uncharacterized protein N7500_008750 [Penicillium coprophilum]|uniref:uncharacterized protein n=1 Tax=Penicillium coprophilum TaxID=36646 RepID=UPI0023A40D06|nr:uncharacterized protein N7500_008750 [Penicillium coprophilum]KAJ5159099.1 hypothetical protein N7500_008750 [Penicillium coprophilum]
MEEVKMLAPKCTDINTLLPLKRKRSDSDATDAPAPTKVCPDLIVTRPTPTVTATESVLPPSTPTTSSNPPVASARPSAQDAVARPSVTRLRETITAQLSLEVLLKHNELRLIDQEIAKCQVALEQLRRCGEIPYPGSRVAGVSPDVSSGTGASVLAPGNGPAPMSPAPWGVTEGPYARHYARWLLPDPRFDGGEVDSGMLGNPMAEGRSTRGNPGEMGMLAGKSRPQRGSTGAKHTALSTGYPVVKEKSGPMLIRRKSDGVLVKLVCLDCRRDNFSSTQGFINHCRIAHNRNFASHDAAAMACGQPVQVDDAGIVVGGSAEPTANPTTSGYVHPLIRSTHVATTPWKSLHTPKDLVTPRKPAATTSVATPPSTAEPAYRRRPEPIRQPPNPQFLASPATPHLSALMKSRGAGLDMDKLVEESRKPVDLGGLFDEDSDTDDTRRPSVGASHASLGARVGRQPMRMPVGQTAGESESRKALDRAHGPPIAQETPSRPQSFLDISLAGQSQALQSRESDSLDHQTLSPHAIESNQAPSLVSDDEDDYEAASDSDSPPSSEADEEEQEFRHIQVEDDDRAAVPSATAEAKPGPSLTSPAPQSGPPLPQPLKRGRPNKISSIVPPSDNDEQHMSYLHSTSAENAAKAKRAAERKPNPSKR